MCFKNLTGNLQEARIEWYYIPVTKDPWWVKGHQWIRRTCHYHWSAHTCSLPLLAFSSSVAWSQLDLLAWVHPTQRSGEILNNAHLHKLLYSIYSHSQPENWNFLGLPCSAWLWTLWCWRVPAHSRPWPKLAPSSPYDNQPSMSNTLHPIIHTKISDTAAIYMYLYHKLNLPIHYFILRLLLTS